MRKGAVKRCSASHSRHRCDSSLGSKRRQAHEAHVVCPLGCGKRVPAGMINLHIDMCLLGVPRGGRSGSVSESTSPLLAADGLSKPVNCPLCSEPVAMQTINAHVDTCLAAYGQTSEDTPSENTFVDVVCKGRSNGENKDNVSDGVAVARSTYVPLHALLRPLQSFAAAKTIQRSKEVPGLFLLPEFVSAEEEAALVASIDGDARTPWRHSSFNGHCYSKTFGVKTHFGLPGNPQARAVRQNNPASGEHDVPEYLRPFPTRLHALVDHLDGVPIELKNFAPNECNCNSYETAENHSLKPHFDDRSLSGPLLMNLSLGCDARMTYISPEGEETMVYLPRRTLQIVIGPARWVFQHSIKAGDVLGERRVSVTWRQAGSKHAGIRDMNTNSDNNSSSRKSSITCINPKFTVV